MADPSLLLLISLLPMVFGCSCVWPPESLCSDYGRSTNVFTGRVINASCNCIPPRNDNSYRYGGADIACLSGDISGEHFSSEVVAGATCDVAGFQPYGPLPCNTILAKFKLIGKV